MAVSGVKRETTTVAEFVKKVGVFEANVIAINPTAEEYKDVLGFELKEDSKQTEYLSVSPEGTSKVRIDVWLQDVKSDFKTKVSFFLEDTKRVNKDGTKKQYVNSVGMCSWASSEDALPAWFVKDRDYRVAMTGEEEFVSFLRVWLGGLDFMHKSTELQLEWKKVIAGNLIDWKNEIGGEWCQTVGALATVKTVDKGDGPKSFQGIYNKAFFPGYAVKNMRLVDYNSSDVVRGLTFKKSAELRPQERFVINVTGEYGCRDFYTFKDLHDYDSEANLVESDKVISTDGADF